MKLTNNQLNEIKLWEYFMPSNCPWMTKTDKDLEIFFEWSENGRHKDYMNINTYKPEGRTYAHALYWGKKRAGIHIHELWEPSVLDDTLPYFTLLGGLENNKKWWQFWKSPHKPLPRYVVDFMKKEMFKGIDAEVIENCYQKIIRSYIKLSTPLQLMNI